MSDFPHTPLPDNTLTSWLGRFIEATKPLAPGQSDSLNINQTTNGVLIEHPGVKNNFVTNWGNYLPSSSYANNSLIYLPSASVFSDRAGNMFSGSAGYYLSQQPIPAGFSATFFTDPYLQAHYSANGRQNGICYDPIDVPNPQYWRKIGSTKNYVSMSLCNSDTGQREVWFVDAYKSGSSPP